MAPHASTLLVCFAAVGVAHLDWAGAPRTVPQPSRQKGGPNTMQQAYAKLQMSMKKSCGAAERTLKANPTLGLRALSVCLNL